MPSESKRWGWLRSQGLGVVLGQLTVVLLAVGSVVIPLTRDGPSKDLHLDELAPFFDSPSVWHLWLYLLLPVLSLYAINTALCTWESVSRRWRGGVRAAHRYGAAVIHVAFVLALIAHLIGAIWGGGGAQYRVGGDWSPLWSGREARVVALDVQTYDDGQPRSVRATMDIRDADGSESRAVLGFNEPLSWAWGSELLLLVRYGQAPAGPSGGLAPAVVAMDRFAPGHPLSLFAGLLAVVGFLMLSRRWLIPLGREPSVHDR